VSIASSYIHALEGRLRVKSASVKGSWQKAREVEAYFQQYDGITEVVANPTTGSVLFHYNSQRLSQNEILGDLQTQGYLAHSERVQHYRTTRPVQVTVKIPEEFGLKLVKTIVTSTVEVALQRLVYALI
jgi:hypothetical protein